MKKCIFGIDVAGERPEDGYESLLFVEPFEVAGLVERTERDI